MMARASKLVVFGERNKHAQHPAFIEDIRRRRVIWELALGAGVSIAVVWLATPPLIGHFVRSTLGPYKQPWNEPDPELPLQSDKSPSVCVVGSGIAGLVAGWTLARRGFRVVVRESAEFAGGKAGTQNITLPDGEVQRIDHGFHAFFRSYYNLNHVMAESGASEDFAQISDYVIVTRSLDSLSFGTLERTPVRNLLQLAKRGVFKWSEVLFGPTKHYMDVFLRYDREQTYSLLGETSFATFCDRARLPDSLRRVFNTFARAFFADDELLSTADIVKSFHFYFLSNDTGLLYDYPTADYQTAVIDPLLRPVHDTGGELRLSDPVQSIVVGDAELTVDDERFDHVVLATDVVGARAIAEASDFGGSGTALIEKLSALRPSQPYAVMRVWVDGSRARDEWPVFVSTERARLLDSITFYHRIDPVCAEWAERHDGAVYELHCYAAPEGASDDEIGAHLLREMEHYLGATEPFHTHLEVRRNFTSFHVVRHLDRPGPVTDVPGLTLAGDWVDCPFPVMLLEAAAATGRLAANEILRAEGLRAEQVWRVPLRGVLADAPHPPKPAWVDFGPATETAP
jgi:isorenieratene synthase